MAGGFLLEKRMETMAEQDFDSRLAADGFDSAGFGRRKGAGSR